MDSSLVDCFAVAAVQEFTCNAAAQEQGATTNPAQLLVAFAAESLNRIACKLPDGSIACINGFTDIAELMINLVSRV